MRNRYVVALTILGAYFIASYLILHAAIADQRSMQRAISISGQQRMYSQRIAMFADAIAAHPSAAERIRETENLKSSIDIFEEAHRLLTNGDPKINPKGWPPANVRSLYFDRHNGVDAQAHAYLAHARALERRANSLQILPSDPDLGYLLDVGPGTFLRSLDSVVHAYDLEQRSSIDTFEYLQLGLLVLGLSTLAAVWFTILMPMEREIAERTTAMARSASQDSLTGALNRVAFANGVEEVLGGSRLGATGAMLMIDIDDFKKINDTFGHGVGDETIVRIAEIIHANARASDYVARFGGDEFAIFAPSFDSESSLDAFVERTCASLNYEFEVAGTRHRVTASIGVARYPLDGNSLQSLIVAADEALYASKRSGKARHEFYARPGAPLAVAHAN